MGGDHFAAAPTALYGAVLMMAAVAYRILVSGIVADEGRDSRVGRAIGGDFKGRVSILLYAGAIPLAFVVQWAAQALHVLVALMWLVPDRRIEGHLGG